MPATRIAYISEASPEDKHAWSGTVHYVYRSLIKAGYTVEALGPARPGAIRYLLAAANQISLKIFRKRLDYRHSHIYARAFGSLFSKKLRKCEHDLVVVCGNTECGAYLKSHKPVVYILDRTIAGAIGYHKILSGLWKFSRDESIATDKKAMSEAHTLIFSSPWAADHAMNFYGISGNNIAVVPFGANMDDIPDRETALRPKDNTTWKILLVGTSWINKGVDIAVRAYEILQSKGHSVTLTIIGCSPPSPIKDNQINIIPFIDKNSPDGIRQMSDLFLNHHVFVLPTRFDCTPIVFCEASAFGLPVLSADTGGVRGHVKEGLNGFLLPYEDKGDGYAAIMENLITERAIYEELRKSARSLFEESLNWDSWSSAFRSLLQKRGLE